MIRSILLLIILVAPVLAQTQAYDIATFSPPPGWRAERRQDSITFTDIDPAARTYCILGVYASTPAASSPEADFSREWEGLVRRGFSAGAAPQPARGRTPSRLSYLEGGAGVRQGAQASHVHLMVFAAGDRTLSVLIVSTDGAAMRARQAALQAFLGSLRITSAVPAPGPGSGITYQVPPGWSRIESNGSVTLARVIDLGFYGGKQDFRLVIMPPERIAGTALQTYQALWRSIMGSTFISPVPPLPLRVRLPGGAALLYDGSTMRLRQNNAELDGFLYAVVGSETVTPIFGCFVGGSEELDRGLRQFFNSVQLPGRAGRLGPLFAPHEIAGVWRSSSTSLANWVDAAGNYRGDASISMGETLTIRPDGAYEWGWAAIGTGSVRRGREVGRFSIDDDFLVLNPNDPGQRPSRHRITGVGRSADGRGSFLLLSITRSDYPFLSAGSRRSGAGDVYVGGR